MYVMKKRLPVFVFFLLLSDAVFGQVWAPKAVGLLPANYNVADISIVNEQVIWAVAFDYHLLPNPIPASFLPKLLRSTDGGETWEGKDIEEAIGRISWDIHAFDENTACITTQNLSGMPGGKGIFRTTDGGDTWTEAFNHVSGASAMHFFDAQEGVCWNWGWGGKAAARTTDGGATWTLVSPDNIPSPMANEGHTFSSASNGFADFGDMLWFGTTRGRMLKTEDRGKTWVVSNTNLGAQSALQSMGFMDEKTGLAVSWVENASSYEIVKTTDGGLNWEHTGHFGFLEVDAIPCSKTFVALEYWDNPRTAISSDIGTTWTEVDSTIDAAAAAFATPQFGWMVEVAQPGVGTGPALYKWIGGSLDTRIYVNRNATGANTGASWADAYTDLQAALAAAQAGDEIWVAEGTYTPAAPGGSQTATFMINKNLKLYGGFGGTECYLSERDVVLHPTVLSGDLNGDDVVDDFVTNRGDNVQHVVQVTATVTNECLMDGFTIKSGHADGTAMTPAWRGGGMLCSGNPVVRQCVFEQNMAVGTGGAVRLDAVASPGAVFENCLFAHNRANVGGGMNTINSHFTLRGCTFTQNETTAGPLEAGGGGIFATNPHGMVENCIFSSNSALDYSGGVNVFVTSTFDGASMEFNGCLFENNSAFSSAGLGIDAYGKNPYCSIVACGFINNKAADYGGGFTWFDQNTTTNAFLKLDSCLFSGNSAKNTSALEIAFGGVNSSFQLTNSTFHDNVATEKYGTAYIYGYGASSGEQVIDNCLFENNTAPNIGGLFTGCWDNSRFDYTISNCDFLHNQVTGVAGGLVFGASTQQTNFMIENCLIEGNTAGERAGGIWAVLQSDNVIVNMDNCRILNNQSPVGAAVAFFRDDAGPLPQNTRFALTNCLIVGNSGLGAAVFADSMPDLKLIHCTVANNTGGGIQLSDQSGLTLQNTILHNPGFAEYTAGTPDLTVTSLGGNLFRDGSLAGHALSYDLQNTDPLFAAAGDYHLAANSPAIDKGVDLFNLPDLDLDGNDRIVGCPDIGAYESATVVSTACVVDTDAPSEVELLAVSPNPVATFLNLPVPETSTGQPFEVAVFDARGRLVLHRSLPAGQPLDVQTLDAGFYALKVVAGERVFAGKFVKQ